MEHMVIKLKYPNEPIMFINTILGNYCFDTFLRDFLAEESPVQDNTVLELLFYTHEPAPKDERKEISEPKLGKKEDFWTLHFNGYKTKEGVGVGCVLIDPEKNKTLIACRLEFDCTNNIIEYEALIQGLRKAIDLGFKDLKVYGDSEIIVKQVRNLIHCVSNRLTKYQQEVWDLLPFFLSFNISFVPHYLNVEADLLANIASQLIPSENFQPNNFSIDLIYRTSVSDNITNWRIFIDDEQIINILTMEETFKGLVIDEDQHDAKIKKGITKSSKTTEENLIPRSVLKLEKFYDLQDNFKRVTKCKTHSSVMLINLGTPNKPQNINLMVQCTPNEKSSSTRLFQEYKDVFAWSYKDLKTFDTQIMQHVIPIKEGAKLVQQKLSKMQPGLELTVKSELNKLLDARIIFPI